jgi:site-specific DNA-methyltransferase (adenine-specific)
LNKLYFGDNLDILREHIATESVDLIYLDPPFNSKRDYSVLFKTPKGHESDAQITAFEDSWHWGEQAEREFADLEHSPNTDVAEMMLALRKFLKENDMMAYLTMMANRLLELHRVLKPTGSLYLHCDPTASHYLKIVLDGVFGPKNFRNEIIWKRKSGRGETNQKTNRFGVDTDILLFYAKTDDNVFVPQFNMEREDYQQYIETRFTHKEEDGRRFRDADLSSPSPRPNLMYEYKGVKPPKKGWAISQEKMQEWDAEGKLWFTRNGGIRRKHYLEDLEGKPVQCLWDDIYPVNPASKEKLGYPTQKPLALLERIIKASSNEGDVVLDPFCGCGTAVHAAQKLGRQWIGIDITHLAISLIEKRLRDAFPGIKFEVEGTPKDLGGARDLAERHKYQFQWWATSLVGAQPYQGKKKGADSGIDGLIFFHDTDKKALGKGKGGVVEHDAKKIIVSVKGGENVNVSMIRDLKGTVEREKAAMGFFVTLQEPTRPMREEAAAAGFYNPEIWNTEYPRLQILTIEGLMTDHERPRYPDIREGATFKRAAVEDVSGEQGKLL